MRDAPWGGCIGLVALMCIGLFVFAAVCVAVLTRLVSPSPPTPQPPAAPAQAGKSGADKKATEEREAAEQKAREERERQDAIKKAEDERKAVAEAVFKKKEDERRRALEAPGLAYYPSPTTLHKGKNAEEWAKYVKDPIGVTDEGVAALTALKGEGMPFLLDMLNHTTDPKLHTALLVGVRPEYIHPNDVPKLIDSLHGKWSNPSRVLALTYLSKRKEFKTYYKDIADAVGDIKSYSDIHGNVSELLEDIAAR